MHILTVHTNTNTYKQIPTMMYLHVLVFIIMYIWHLYMHIHTNTCNTNLPNKIQVALGSEKVHVFACCFGMYLVYIYNVYHVLLIYWNVLHVLMRLTLFHAKIHAIHANTLAIHAYTSTCIACIRMQYMQIKR